MREERGDKRNQRGWRTQRERQRARAKKVRENVFDAQYKSLLPFSGGRGGGVKAIPRTACCSQKTDCIFNYLK